MIARMSTWHAAAVLAGALFLAGCGASADEFSTADPAGYDACQAFADSEGAGGNVRRDEMDQAANLGLEAETAGIRAAVDDRSGGTDGAPVIPVLSDFENACKNAGFNF